MTRALLVTALAAALAAGSAHGATSPLVERGHQLYGEYCVACHGIGGSGIAAPTEIGAGPGRDQTQQRVVAPSLVGVGALAADFYVRTGYMPLPHAGMQPKRRRVRFDEADIQALVAYVASLGPGPAVPEPHPERGSVAQGLRLFTDDCAGCHQVVGEGGYVTGAVPPPLEDATSTQVAEAVRIGPYVMPRFPKSQISDPELDSIVAYVQYAKGPDDRGGWALGHLGPVPEGMVTWLIAASSLVAVCIVIGRRLKT